MEYDRPTVALSPGGWAKVDRDFRKNAPIRYYIVNTFPQTYIWPIKWKIRSVREFFRYRFIPRHRYHKVDTGLKPDYYDSDSRMFHASFNLLVDFVEIELAWHHMWCDPDGAGRKRPGRLASMLGRQRFPDTGISHLEWEISLGDPKLTVNERSPRQAEAAIEKLSLYLWYKDRPNRKQLDIWPPWEEDEGIMERLSKWDDDKDSDEYKKHRASMDALTKQENDWFEEDEANFIRLIKIRSSMWT